MTEPTATEPIVTPKTFDEILSENKDYQSEFDKRVQKAIDKRVAAVQKEHDLAIAKRDEDLKALQGLADDKTGLENKIKQLETDYQKQADEFKATQAQQAYEFAVKTKAKELEFTSVGAENYFISQALAKKLSMGEDGNILGFDDYLNEYVKGDPSAIKAKEPEQSPTTPTPAIVPPTTPTPQADKNAFNFGFRPVNAPQGQK